MLFFKTAILLCAARDAQQEMRSAKPGNHLKWLNNMSILVYLVYMIQLTPDNSNLALTRTTTVILPSVTRTFR